MTTVAIVEDHGALRIFLRDTLNKLGWDVTGVAGTAETGEELILGTGPDVAVVDLHLASEGGGEGLIRRLAESESSTKLLVFTATTDPTELGSVLNAGADGIVLKEGGLPELIDGLNAVSPRRALRQPVPRALEPRRARRSAPGSGASVGVPVGVASGVAVSVGTAVGVAVAFGSGVAVAEGFTAVSSRTQRSMREPWIRNATATVLPVPAPQGAGACGRSVSLNVPTTKCGSSLRRVEISFAPQGSDELNCLTSSSVSSTSQPGVEFETSVGTVK